MAPAPPSLVWIVGQGLGLLGFAFHALALFNGPISLVQPIIITGIVFAVPVRAAISRHWPEPRELGAVALTAAALVAFLLASNPSEGSGVPDGPVFLLLVVGSALVGFAVFTLARLLRQGTEQAFLMGAGAGFLFGLVAVLIKATERQLSEGGCRPDDHDLAALRRPRRGPVRGGAQPVGLPLGAALGVDAGAQRGQHPARALLRLPGLRRGAPHHADPRSRSSSPGWRPCASGLWILANFEEKHVDELVHVDLDLDGDVTLDQRT